ncbi:hypothetical protein GCM10010260_73610 [Streptomyces filipinensis]|uniref:Transposase n=1 Tax=Streptomyces filipinensis TaxID=66887 RepID=A0A918MFE7_9ACTN|nr:hypothetical protein GCM10010260_73610 [Streptomyces filipinensis]
MRQPASARGGPRRSPDVVLADRVYDHDKYRRLVRDLGVQPLIARRRTRREIRDDIREAFPPLGHALICRRRLFSLRGGLEGGVAFGFLGGQDTGNRTGTGPGDHGVAALWDHWGDLCPRFHHG